MKRIRVMFSSVLLILGTAAGQTPADKDLDPSLTCTATGWPTVVQAEVPLYPQLATQAHQSGVVDVAITIKAGLVVKAETKSTASPILVNAATNNAKTWRFAADVDTDTSITYIYQLVPYLPSPIIEMRRPGCVTIKTKPAEPMTNRS
jgi:hypothetical protein